MPPSKLCWKRSLLTGGHLTLVALSCFLLIYQRYFALPGLNSLWSFGLSGISRPSDFITYSDFATDCKSLSEAAFICELAPRLATSGFVLQFSLSFSLILEICSLLHHTLTLLLLRLSIRAIARGQRLHPYLPSVMKVLSCLQYLSLFQPLVTLFGVVYWPVEARLPELTHRYDITAQAGLVILAVYSGMSLCFYAYLTLRIVENRQKNSRLAVERQDTRATRKIDTEKIGSGGITLDETTVGL